VRTGALGLAGWAVRLLFVAGAGVGAVGVYIALFASLGRSARGHEWLLGFTVMSCGMAISAVGFALACRRWRGPALPGSPRSRAGWYAGSSALFAVTAIALLCLSSGLRLGEDWRRGTVTVSASVFGCAPVPGDGFGTTNQCTYEWQWKGVRHSAGISGHPSYPDGTALEMRIDPVTGESSDPSRSARTFSFVGALMAGVFGLIVCGFLAASAYQRRHRLRWWLGSWAWWLPPRPMPQAVGRGARTR